MPKLLKQVSGQLTEESTVTTSSGAGSANRVPELNASGVLDATIINAKNTSAGAGDAGKVAQLNANGVLDSTIVNSKASSAGAGDAGKLVALDSGGRIDSTMMPTGIGADTASITASEALAAGDYVNVWNDAGTAKVRKADASAAGKEANGFVLSAVSANAQATVYFEGTNTQNTGLTAGRVYLSATTAGKATNVVPSTANQVVQLVGFATSATAVNFQYNPSITLA